MAMIRLKKNLRHFDHQFFNLQQQIFTINIRQSIFSARNPLPHKPCITREYKKYALKACLT